MGFTKTVPQLLWVNAFSSVGAAGLRPALTSLVTQKAGKREQGMIIGLTQSLMSIAQITAPLISGLLIERHYLTTWAISLCCSSRDITERIPRFFDPSGAAVRAKEVRVGLHCFFLLYRLPVALFS